MHSLTHIFHSLTQSLIYDQTNKHTAQQCMHAMICSGLKRPACIGFATLLTAKKEVLQLRVLHVVPHVKCRGYTIPTGLTLGALRPRAKPALNAAFSMAALESGGGGGGGRRGGCAFGGGGGSIT